MKLYGWQKIWVSLAAVWFIVIGSVTFVLLSDIEPTPRVDVISEDVESIPEEQDAELDRGMQAARERKAADIERRRERILLSMLAVWAVPLAILYMRLLIDNHVSERDMAAWLLRNKRLESPEERQDSPSRGNINADT